MSYMGDYDTSTIIYGKFTTYQPSTGAAFALAGTPALSVYKDNSTTQSTSGVTLTASFDSVTGLNHYAIDTSSDGTFYSAGSFFSVVITTGTVDSVSVVGTVVAEFTLRVNSSLKPTTAGRTLDVSSGGEAGVDWANVGSPTTTLNLSGTTVKTATDVETDTADIQSRLPAALTGDGNIKADTLRVGGTLQTARDLGLSVLLSSGTGTGQISLSSGAVLLQATQTGVTIPTVTNLTNAPTSGDFTATMKTSITTAATAATPTVTAGTVTDKTGYALTSGERNSVADALLDRADAIESGITVRQAHRLEVAVAAGKLSGAATTTVAIRDLADTKDRISATVDADGNRSAVTVDVS